jgi:tetratricopeptide (TPR) repeat protein
VTGDQLRAAEALDIWKASYPRDYRPPNALALIYNRLGMYDRAVEEARESLARSPGQPFPLSNLAAAYRGLNRNREAADVGEQALKLGVATVPTRRLLYQIAVMTNDKAAEQAQLDWARGRPREFDMVAAQAQVLAYHGRMREARELYRQVIDLAGRQGLGEVASGYQAQLTWTEALYGNPGDAAEESQRVAAAAAARQSLISGPLPRFRLVASMALIGETRNTEAVLQEAIARYPESTLVRTVFVPVTRATLAIHAGKPDEGLEALRAAAPYEFGTVAGGTPSYIRAQVYLAKRSGADAAAELERLLAHRGADPFSPIYALAHLGLARAYALTGDRAKSADAYRRFFDLWREADADLPILQQAKAEFGKLTE